MDVIKYKNDIILGAIEYGDISVLLYNGLCTRKEIVDLFVTIPGPLDPTCRSLASNLFFLVNPVKDDEALGDRWSVLYASDGRHLIEVFPELGGFFYLIGMDLTQRDSMNRMLGSYPEVMKEVSQFLRQPNKIPYKTTSNDYFGMICIHYNEGLPAICLKNAPHYSAYVLSLPGNYFFNKRLAPSNYDCPDIDDSCMKVTLRYATMLKKLQPICPDAVPVNIRNLSLLAISVLWSFYKVKQEKLHLLLGFPKIDEQSWEVYLERCRLLSEEPEKFYNLIRMYNNRPDYDCAGNQIFPSLSERSPRGHLISDLPPLAITRVIDFKCYPPIIRRTCTDVEHDISLKMLHDGITSGMEREDQNN